MKGRFNISKKKMKVKLVTEIPSFSFVLVPRSSQTDCFLFHSANSWMEVETHANTNNSLHIRISKGCNQRKVVFLTALLSGSMSSFFLSLSQPFLIELFHYICTLLTRICPVRVSERSRGNERVPFLPSPFLYDSPLALRNIQQKDETWPNIIYFEQHRGQERLRDFLK